MAKPDDEYRGDVKLPKLDELIIALVDRAYPGDNSAQRILYCMLAHEAAAELTQTRTENRTPTVVARGKA